ncbi:MAG: toxin-antitoxin system YwqK family antitoxin [Akkermansiaceae bacterium]|nr:toxin-antitoxin system YwqK family antitoxin [Akkermansiaceae bacterium]
MTPKTIWFTLAATALLSSPTPARNADPGRALSAGSCDETVAKKPREIPAKIDSEFRPEVGVEYTLAAPSMFHPAHAGDPGPSERDTSAAWSFAIEFVYRTALAKEYAVPAGQAGPTKGGWFQVGFTSRDGKALLTVEVQIERHVARLQPHGTETLFYEDGQKRSVENYERGKRHGWFVFWNRNGKKQREEHYKNGALDGLTRTWHDNGVISSEIQFLDGTKHGQQLSWYRNGWKEAEFVFDQGKLVKQDILEIT